MNMLTLRAARILRLECGGHAPVSPNQQPVGLNPAREAVRRGGAGGNALSKQLMNGFRRHTDPVIGCRQSPKRARELGLQQPPRLHSHLKTCGAPWVSHNRTAAENR